MKIKIGHIYPDLLNLYGDRGNIECLRMRCVWRGIEAKVQQYRLGEKIDLENLDIVLLGGGSDREQMIVCTRLLENQASWKSYVEDNGTVIAVCGGYQLLGHYYDTSEGRMEGLSLVDAYTEQGSPRLISNIILENELFSRPIVGFENHGGRTYINKDSCKPFGRVVFGHGNNGTDQEEGVMYKNVVGTYLHGPLLPKNPQVADYLIASALTRKYGRADLAPLDDAWENEANEDIVRRFAGKQ